DEHWRSQEGRYIADQEDRQQRSRFPSTLSALGLRQYQRGQHPAREDLKIGGQLDAITRKSESPEKSDRNQKKGRQGTNAPAGKSEANPDDREDSVELKLRADGPDRR